MRSARPCSRPLRWLTPSDSPSARRVVVAGVAGALLTAPLSLQQFMARVPPLGYALTAAGAILAVLCCRRHWKPSTALTWGASFVCVGFVTATLTQGIGQVATGLGRSQSQLLCVDDVSPSIVAGGQEILRGSNPYTSFSVLPAERSFGCPTFHVTPLHSGLFASRVTEPTDEELNVVAQASVNAPASSSLVLGFSYPAGSALIGMAGAQGVVVLNVLLLLVAGVFVVSMSPPTMRRWVALALASQTGALVLVGQSRPDGIVAALLIIACARREPLVSGGTLGLACAIKQTAWFVAPALVLLAFRRGRKSGLEETAAAATMFAILNLPFVAADPAAWLRGVLAPATSGFPLGGGPVGLFTAAGRPAVVMEAFTAVMAMTVLVGCVLAWRGRHGWAEAGVIVSSIALWDGPRSLLFYFGLLGLVAVSICARDLPRHAAEARDHPGATRRRPLPQLAL